jgi:excinuclease ABC subunit C
MDLKEKLKNLPEAPGVYLMKDSSNSIIYVGKSKNLKNRVSSYFHESKNRSPKVAKLVKHLKDFDLILTDTEFEAFILECRLIKDIKPIYNKLMKSPMSYNFIRISKDYLNIEICSEKTNTIGNYYFGPYTRKSSVEKALEGIKETCRIKCSGNYKSSSPCLNYSLGTCLGFCFDASAKAKYPIIIEQISGMFNGTGKEILNEMELKMISAAEKLDFDTAAKYRDYINAINGLINREKVIEFAKENENIVVIEPLDESNIKLFLISGTNIIFKEKYTLADTDFSNLISSISDVIVTLFKDSALENSLEIGKNEIDETQIIYTYLNSEQNGCNYFVVPKDWILRKDVESLKNSIYSILKSKK